MGRDRRHPEARPGRLRRPGGRPGPAGRPRRPPARSPCLTWGSRDRTVFMAWFKPSGLLDRTFEISIMLKGLDGVLELVGGVLLLFVSPTSINQFIGRIT